MQNSFTNECSITNHGHIALKITLLIDLLMYYISFCLCVHMQVLGTVGVGLSLDLQVSNSNTEPFFINYEGLN